MHVAFDLIYLYFYILILFIYTHVQLNKKSLQVLNMIINYYYKNNIQTPIQA